MKMFDKESLIIEDARRERNLKFVWMERFYTLNAWLQQINKKESMEGLLKKKGIKKFIVYGTEEIGLRFIDNCMNEGIDILAIADKNIKAGDYRYMDIPMISTKEMYKLAGEEVTIIITSAGYYAGTEKELKEFKNKILLRDLFS